MGPGNITDSVTDIASNLTKIPSTVTSKTNTSNQPNPALYGPTTADTLTAYNSTSGNNLSVGQQTTADASGGAHLSDSEIEETARDILDVGDRRWRSDDYDKRLDAYAEVVSKLDTDSAALLHAEILRQDPGVHRSWLSAHRVGELTESGRISEAERAALADGFVTAYNDQLISQSEAESFLDVWNASQFAPGLHPEYHQRPLDFLNAASGPEADAFRKEFASQIVNREVNKDLRRDDQLLAYATTILNGSSDPTAAADLYHSLGAEQRQQYLEGLASSGIGYINSGVADPLSGLIESVAATPGRGQDALEIVHFADSAHKNFFYEHDNVPLDQRAEALGALFEAHDSVILRELTKLDINGIPGSSNGDTVAYRNAEALGNLLRITAFNEDNSHQQAVLDSVADFAGDMKERVNQSPEGLTDYQLQQRELAIDSLKMLGISAKEAIDQAYDDKRATAEATRALVGFVVDVGLAAIPGGLSGYAAKNVVSNLFGSQSEAVQNALNGVAGAIFKPGTTELTDSAKDAIVEALGEETGNIEAMRITADSLIQDAILNGLNRETSEIKADILNGAEDLRNR